MALCPRGFQKMKAMRTLDIDKADQMDERGKKRLRLSIDPSIHPGSFALDSVESRAAARALAESREPSEFHCGTCFLAGLPVMGSGQPDFIPNEKMEMGSRGWVYKCPKHTDPSKEATVQDMIRSGLLGG
jgi:hypothetical protein